MADVPAGRFDERDTLFARMARTRGTPAYDDYYGRLRPDLRETDDRLRAMPPLLDPRGRHYDVEIARQTAAYFDGIEDIEVDVALARRHAEGLGTAEIKALCGELGAVAAGCTAVDPAFVYTHKGRFDENYGRPIELDHPHVLVFLVEMDHDSMRRAPLADTLLESARQYWRAAGIAKQVAATIEAAGWSARAHYDAHYDLILPPLAVAAGLGEVGRNNILVADRFGARVRIGAVTTDLPVAHDSPVDLGVGHFCETCRKCARTCPSHALSLGEREPMGGTMRWPTNVERCHAWWRQVGTDCGICMASCPFSHPDSAFHALVRGTVRRLPWTRRIMRFLDDVFYGRGWTPDISPRGEDAGR